VERLGIKVGPLTIRPELSEEVRHTFMHSGKRIANVDVLLSFVSPLSTN
jgi:hypothetical protein